MSNKDDYDDVDIDLLKAICGQIEKDELEASRKKGSSHSLFSMMTIAKEKIRTDTERERREEAHAYQ